jgi:hypothetical protein
MRDVLVLFVHAVVTVERFSRAGFVSTLAFSHRLCEIFASNLHVTGCLANQVSYQVTGFMNVADEAPGLLDMRDSAGCSPH